MTRRRVIPVVVLAMFSLAVSACGDDAAQSTATTTPAGMSDSTATTTPAGMSDEEVVLAAAPICDTLAADLAAFEAIQFTGNEAISAYYDHGPAYRKAAATMSELGFSAESARDASELVTRLGAAADGWDVFHAAVQAEIAAIDSPVDSIFVTEAGEVYIIVADQEEIVTGGIPPNLYLTVAAAEVVVGVTARSLGLTACLPHSAG